MKSLLTDSKYVGRVPLRCAALLCVFALSFSRAPADELQQRTPAIIVVADSAGVSVPGKFVGWGDMLSYYFDPARVQTSNFSKGGVNARSLYERGVWKEICGQVRPGDYVLLQFGLNEAKPADADRDAGSLPGVGDETAEVSMSDGTKLTVHTYGWYISHFIAEVARKGGIPIVLSSTVHNIWHGTELEPDKNPCNEWAASVAKNSGAKFIDLVKMLAVEYQFLGSEEVKKFFPVDHVHTNRLGADLTAAAVVVGWKQLGDERLAGMLSEEGRDLALSSTGCAENIVSRSTVPVDPARPTLFLMGDSALRVANGTGAGGQWGWGDRIGDFIDVSKINIVNAPVADASARSYLRSEEWSELLSQMKAGDVVLISFGHADSGPVEGGKRPRGALPGSGDEKKEVSHTQKGRMETVLSYGAYLRIFVQQIKDTGARPILLSPTPLNRWRQGRIVRATETFDKWTKEVAEENMVDFIDLNNLAADEYDKLGQDKAQRLFADLDFNTKQKGASLHASCVVESLKALKIASIADASNDEIKSDLKQVLNPGLGREARAAQVGGNDRRSAALVTR